MLKTLTTVQHVIGQNVYRLECDPASPIAEVKEALAQFMKYVGNIEDQVKAKAEAEKQAADAVKEDQPPNEAANV